MNDLYESLSIGDTVYWNDPDEGLSSGEYTITHKGVFDEEYTMIYLYNGFSETEVFLSEIETIS